MYTCDAFVSHGIAVLWKIISLPVIIFTTVNLNNLKLPEGRKKNKKLHTLDFNIAEELYFIYFFRATGLNLYWVHSICVITVVVIMCYSTAQ